jgi:hypothetical protein
MPSHAWCAPRVTRHTLIWYSSSCHTRVIPPPRSYCDLPCLLPACLFTYFLTHSIQHSPSWESNRFSASQEIPHTLWNPKAHYCIHKCPPPVPFLSQLNSFHTPTSHFLKIHLNIIIPYAWVSQVVSFTQVSPPKCCIHLSSPSYMLPVLAISFFLILSPTEQWVSSTDHSAPHYVSFFTPLSPRPS